MTLENYLLMEDEMNEKTVTTKELAQALNVSVDTVTRTAAKILDLSAVQRRVINGGQSMIFDEVQATMLKKEIAKHHNLASRQIDTATTELEVIANALNAFKALQDLYTHKEAEYKATIEAQKEKIALDAPKVETYNRIANSTGLKTMQEAAKLLGIGSNTLFSVLRDKRIFYRSNGVNLPAEKYIKRGLFEVKEEPYKRDNKDFVYTRVFATAKGLLWLEKQIVKAA